MHFFCFQFIAFLVVFEHFVKSQYTTFFTIYTTIQHDRFRRFSRKDTRQNLESFALIKEQFRLSTLFFKTKFLQYFTLLTTIA